MEIIEKLNDASGLISFRRGAEISILPIEILNCTLTLNRCNKDI
jgi:hypothetical protein